ARRLGRRIGRGGIRHARSHVGVIAVLAAGSESGDGKGEQGGGRDTFDVLHVFSVEGKGPGADPREPAPGGPRRKEHGKRRGRGEGQAASRCCAARWLPPCSASRVSFSSVAFSSSRVSRISGRA